MLLATKITEEQRLQKCVVDIMRHPRYMWSAGVLMLGKLEVVEDIPTARTNGIDVQFGRAFIQSLTDAQLRFVLLHELYHKIYKHLTTWRWMYDKDAELANASCDFNINGKLVDENKKPDYRINGRMEQFATMPTNSDGERIGLFDERYRVKDGWMDSAAIFKQLYKERRGGGGTGRGAGDDDTTANQNVKEGGAEVTNGQPSNSLPQGFDEHDWEGAQKIPTEEQKKNVREIDEALRQGAMAAGKMGSGGNRSLEELLAPQVDWQEVMRAFVNDVCRGNHFSTWKKPNRRYIGANIFMPSGISETVEDLVCSIDTSLSIQQWHITLFLSELADLCETVRPNRVRLLYWDTQVCGEEIYEGEEIDSIRTSTKPKGGGGTSIRCVTNYYKAHDIRPTASIVFTDGYLGGDWGDWDTPLLWCLLNNNAAKPPIGSYVHIDESKL